MEDRKQARTASLGNLIEKIGLPEGLDEKIHRPSSYSYHSR